MKRNLWMVVGLLATTWVASAPAAPRGDEGAKRPLAAPGGPCREDPDARYRVSLGDAPRRGADRPLVTVVVFSDYQCPYCGRFDAVLDEALAAYPDDLAVVYKQMPLAMHADARPAAEAALAAHAQGKFAEMHRRLFADPHALSRADLEVYAAEAGLDLAKFFAALDEHRFAAAVDADVAQAERFDVSGTPSYFVNGRKEAGAATREILFGQIDEALAEARGWVEGGLARGGVYDRVMDLGSARVRCLAPEAEGARPRDRRPPEAPPEPPEVQDVRTAPFNLARGPVTAPVTLVVFTEYLCPYCARLEATLDELLAAYGGRVRVVYRYAIVHPEARLHARAVLAAGMQGRQAEMHAALFAAQSELRAGGEEKVAALAAELGLDAARFQADLDGEATASRLAEDLAEAERLGVRATPTIYVNGRRVSGARPASAFGELIDPLLGITTPTFP